MDSPSKAIGIVLQIVKDEGNIEETLRSLQSYQLDAGYSLNIILWCTNCSKIYADSNRHILGLRVIQSGYTFLSSLKSSLNFVMQFKLVILCKAGVNLANCIDTILQKNIEYGDEVPLSAMGIRLFPHKPLQSGEKLREGVHWKGYDHEKEDRAVHCLTTDLCSFSVEVLKRIATLDFDINIDSAFDGMWISFVIGYYLNLTVWKIKCAEVNYIPNLCYNDSIPLPFYNHICKLNWPKGICNPYYRTSKRETTFLQISPEILWKQGFGGINMSIEPASEIDFKAAVAYGVKVIRVGAVCDAKDLNFLLDPASKDEHDDKHHLLLVLPRLKRAIQRATSAGLKVILTMSDLPGCPFCLYADSSFWSSPAHRIRAARFWGVLAEGLVSMKSCIMGYDLINEPYTPKDQDAGYFDDIPFAYKAELQHFYKTALEEIRKHDKDTTVIVTSTYYASPRAIDMLTPLPDSNVAYSVHIYGPPQLTYPRKFQFFKSLSLSYPGTVPKWKKRISDKVEINFQYLYTLLQTVHEWQRKNNIPTHQVLIAEFGASRELPGSQQFLTDLVTIFNMFKWNWLLFSFRDEEWDAMDYELGSDMDNMLDRKADPLFLSVAEYFH